MNLISAILRVILNILFYSSSFKKKPVRSKILSSGLLMGEVIDGNSWPNDAGGETRPSIVQGNEDAEELQTYLHEKQQGFVDQLEMQVRLEAKTIPPGNSEQLVSPQEEGTSLNIPSLADFNTSNSAKVAKEKKAEPVPQMKSTPRLSGSSSVALELPGPGSLHLSVILPA